MESKLVLSGAEIRRLGDAALDLMVDYYTSLPSRRVMPAVTSAGLRETLAEPLPQHGMEVDAILRTIRDVIVEGVRHNGHPRFFGYVASPGNPLSAVGDLVASIINANVTSWRSAPAAAELERVVCGWMKEIFGFPESALGVLVSGGSMAHLSALAAARSMKAGASVSRAGLRGTPRALRIYMSEQGHFSIPKAASLLGIGSDNVVAVATDAAFRIDLSLLEEHINEDLRAGHIPMCIVANAGAVATGAIDPMVDLAAIAKRYNIWLHVDGCYGGFAVLSPAHQGLFAGIGDADSIAVDPHKWLYSSAGCGCVLYRDPAAARAAFAENAEYTRMVGFEDEESFAFWDYGPELSRRFRALSIWMLIKYAGAEDIGSAIESNIRCAEYFRHLVNQSDDFEMLAPVPLSIFCFRYASCENPDSFNERILAALQREGNSYLSNARIGGKFALRGCVLNYRTQLSDMEQLLSDIRRIVQKIR